MSGYTIGEIVVWLVLAALLGGILGWLLRTLKCRAEHSSDTTTHSIAKSSSLTAKSSSGLSATKTDKSGGDTAAKDKPTAGTSTVATSATTDTAADKLATDTTDDSARPVGLVDVDTADADKNSTRSSPASSNPVGHTADATTATGNTADGDKTATDFEPDVHPNSAKPLAGGAAPGPEWVIKGNADSMIYHTPESRSYGATMAETWFRTAEDAQAAGFRPPRR